MTITLTADEARKIKEALREGYRLFDMYYEDNYLGITGKQREAKIKEALALLDRAGGGAG